MKKKTVEGGKFESAASFYLSTFNVPSSCPCEFQTRYLRMFKRLIRSA